MGRTREALNAIFGTKLARVDPLIDPIDPFCDDGPIDDSDLMPEDPIDPSSIEPFGFWLERHVHEILSEIEHRLRFLNGR